MFFLVYLVGTATDKNGREKGFEINIRDLRNKNTFIEFVRVFLLLLLQILQKLYEIKFIEADNDGEFEKMEYAYHETVARENKEYRENISRLRAKRAYDEELLFQS